MRSRSPADVGVIPRTISLLDLAVVASVTMVCMVYTGLAFAYDASVGWFGGTTPLIAAMLIAQTGDPISPSYWVALAG